MQIRFPPESTTRDLLNGYCPSLSIVSPTGFIFATARNKNTTDYAKKWLTPARSFA